MSKTSLRRSKICPTLGGLGHIYLKDFLPELTKSCPPLSSPPHPQSKTKAPALATAQHCSIPNSFRLFSDVESPSSLLPSNASCAAGS